MPLAEFLRRSSVQGMVGPGQMGPVREGAFQQWYADQAAKWGLDPDPDHPEHHYDHRAAYMAGAEPDAHGHWPSEFKTETHPNRFVDGRDTRGPSPLATEPRYDPSVLPGARELLSKGASLGPEMRPYLPHTLSDAAPIHAQIEHDVVRQPQHFLAAPIARPGEPRTEREALTEQERAKVEEILQRYAEPAEAS